jgi:hypothetical protein
VDAHDSRPRFASRLTQSRLKDNDMISWATEIKVRAERRAGELTRAIEKRQGQRTSSHDEKKSKAQVLKEIDVAPATANRWEKLATMQEEQFEAAIAVIYPEAKRGRGNVDPAKAVESTGFSASYLLHARTVLHFAPPLVNVVPAGDGGGEDLPRSSARTRQC